MPDRLLNFLKDEVDRDPAFVRVARNILIFVMIANLAALLLVTGITGEEARNPLAFITLVASLSLQIIAFIYILRGQVLPAKAVVPFGLIASIVIISLDTNGLRNTSMLAMPGIIIISAILLGRRSLTVTLPLMIASIILIASVDIRTGNDPEPIGIDDAIIAPVLILTTAGITQLLIARLNESTERARRSEQEQRQENAELLALRASLEERVHDRTAELENANRVNEKRARQFRAVAQVMSAASNVQSLDELLPLVTRVICEQFNVYHTGIFLLDEKRENAVLRAANSEGGRKMLARKHALPVGQTGIVGFVAATGQLRIALDVGADSVYFDNPDLPDTRSEIALPLRYASRIIGVLDVQSVEPDAFRSDVADVLSTLADQVAVSINNARTFEEAQKTLAEAQSAVGQIAREAWQILRPQKLGLGFSFTDAGLKPLQIPIEHEQVRESMTRDKSVRGMGPGNRPRLVIPVRLRGQVIGVLQLSARNEAVLTDDDADIAEAVAERLSLAIETAILLESTQHRADLERVTADITSKVSSSTRFEIILQTAARELSAALGGSDVIVQIEPASLKINP
jgi:GAF domain-containing protein